MHVINVHVGAYVHMCAEICHVCKHTRFHIHYEHMNGSHGHLEIMPNV